MIFFSSAMIAPFVVRLLKNKYHKHFGILKQFADWRHLIVMITIKPTGVIISCQGKIKKIASTIFLYYADG
jgi:hypothetical protein